MIRALAAALAVLAIPSPAHAERSYARVFCVGMWCQIVMADPLPAQLDPRCCVMRGAIGAHGIGRIRSWEPVCAPRRK